MHIHMCYLCIYIFIYTYNVCIATAAEYARGRFPHRSSAFSKRFFDSLNDEEIVSDSGGSYRDCSMGSLELESLPLSLANAS
jgi:hypothetical protein